MRLCCDKSPCDPLIDSYTLEKKLVWKKDTGLESDKEY